MPRKISNGRWIEDLITSIEKNVNFETTDGVTRGGRLSGFTFRTFHLNGREVHAPIEIELNGDPNDRVPIDRLLKINIG